VGTTISVICLTTDFVVCDISISGRRERREEGEEGGGRREEGGGRREEGVDTRTWAIYSTTDFVVCDKQGEGLKKRREKEREGEAEGEESFHPLLGNIANGDMGAALVPVCSSNRGNVTSGTFGGNRALANAVRYLLWRERKGEGRERRGGRGEGGRGRERLWNPMFK
jgi:hypothetical protein